MTVRRARRAVWQAVLRLRFSDDDVALCKENPETRTALEVEIRARTRQDQVRRLARDHQAAVINWGFSAFVSLARGGVRSIAIDAGLGFFYGPEVDPISKIRHQAQVLLHSFRLRSLRMKKEK